MPLNASERSSGAISVDLIRVVAIFAVLLLHAGVYGANIYSFQGDWEVWRGWVVNVYLCFGRLGVPLFLMLSGALLLAPSKMDEGFGVFFRKRFSRVGLPFLFWGVIYFLWDIYIEKQPATIEFFINGILSGPYITFWYLYLLAGLYLVTPLLRVMVANFTDKHFKYFIGLWIAGMMLMSWIKFVSNGQYALDGNLFVIPLSVGYFVMGAYLVKLQIRRRILAALVAVSLALTAVGTYFVAWKVDYVFFFQEYTSATILIASAAMFLLLNSYAKPPLPTQTELQTEKRPWKQRIIQTISENSLPIYLFHMIALSLIKNGFFGAQLNGYTVNSIIGMPLQVILTLLLCLIIIIPLKKVPILKKLIG